MLYSDILLFIFIGATYIIKFSIFFFLCSRFLCFKATIFFTNPDDLSPSITPG
jgi:hypothetical protein